MSLDADIVTFAQQPNFATLTTLRPDGFPATQPMWVDADEEHILINTERHRRKFQHVQSDPRVTVTIIDHANPYNYVEVRGTVVDVIGGQQARDHIDQLSQKYLGQPYGTPIQSERVILKISPVTHSGKSS
jgi:PPOX class probable F420-dependent enzyme